MTKLNATAQWFQGTLEILLEKTERMLEQTKNLLETEIKKIDKNCNSFKSVGGSKTLAMLASFERGRYILKLLLKNEALVFNISGYSVSSAYGARTINLTEGRRYNYTGLKEKKIREPYRQVVQVRYRSLSENNQDKSINENALMVLIRELEYNLYHLLLNRVLLDSKKSGPECLSVLKDTVLLLLEMKNSGILISLHY